MENRHLDQWPGATQRVVGGGSFKMEKKLKKQQSAMVYLQMKSSPITEQTPGVPRHFPPVQPSRAHSQGQQHSRLGLGRDKRKRSLPGTDREMRARAPSRLGQRRARGEAESPAGSASFLRFPGPTLGVRMCSIAGPRLQHLRASSCRPADPGLWPHLLGAAASARGWRAGPGAPRGPRARSFPAALLPPGPASRHHAHWIWVISERGLSREKTTLHIPSRASAAPLGSLQPAKR